MKKYFAPFLALLIVLCACCAPKPPAHARLPEKAPDVTTVAVWRDFEVTLHVDKDFSDQGRTLIRAAADNVRRLTHDRARLSVVFDLDFESLTNLKEHQDAGHSLVIGVLSNFDVVATIDASLKSPGSVLAATVQLSNDSQVVFLILDRIPAEKFESVTTHEFGHVIGFPDLDALGARMSGRSVRGVPDPNDWTPADVELCRSMRYCD